MIVRRVQLKAFRNYANLDAAFSPELNVIYGENAQGKTNLLEAVAYLSAARSHRARYDRELIQFGAERAALSAEVFSRERTFAVEIKLYKNARRQIFSNGVRLKTAGDLAGIVNIVFFCPEDLYLIRQGAAVRRRFLDDCICQLRPKYAAALAEYKRLHEHKTRILRDWPDNPSLLDTLDDFNLRMAQTGAIVIHYRAHFVRKLMETAPPIHREFSGERENLTLTYQTVKTVADPLLPPRELLPRLMEHQESHRRPELDARQCLSGPHKDDLLVEINGLPAKEYGSQGQTRTAVLSLKLGCREIFYQDSGEYPVLLLDDVLSELDARRQEFVLRRITGGQVFLTCCEEERLAGLERGQAFHIRDGALTL